MTVNPFVIKMQKHVSFKSWIKLYKENLAKRFNQKAQDGDVTISEADLKANEEEELKNAEHYYETEKDETCSEYDQIGEEDEDEMGSQQIRTINKELTKLDGQNPGYSTERHPAPSSSKKRSGNA